MRRFMVVERFRPGAMAAAYERFETKGRLLPDGLHYVDSWLAAEAETCFQLMRTEDPTLFPIWFARWEDLVEFELHEIEKRAARFTSKTEAASQPIRRHRP